MVIGGAHDEDLGGAAELGGAEPAPGGRVVGLVLQREMAGASGQRVCEEGRGGGVHCWRRRQRAAVPAEAGVSHLAASPIRPTPA